MNQEEELKKYIEDNIDVAGFTKAEKDEIINGLVKNISTALSIEVFERLNDQDRTKFLTLSQLNKSTELLKFIASKIKDLPLLADETAQKTIQEFNELRKNDSQETF